MSNHYKRMQPDQFKSAAESLAIRHLLATDREGAGLDDFDFFPDVAPQDVSPEDTAIQEFERQARGLSQMMVLSPKLMRSSKIISMAGGKFNYVSPHKAWFVYIEDAMSTQAARIGKQFFQNLRGRRNVPANLPALHQVPLWVGTGDGKVTRVDPPVSKRAINMQRLARNQKIIEAPHGYYKVKVQPPKAKRTEYPFEGYIDFQGLKIDVENVAGSTRSGTGPEGDWSTYMHIHYGEIRGTEGTDGDKLDVYVGDNHDSSVVVVVHQYNPWDGKYDEDKVMIGFDSVQESIGAYLKQYDRPGFYRDGEHTAMPMGAFWRWVHDRKNKGKRVTAAMARKASNRYQQSLDRANIPAPPGGDILDLEYRSGSGDWYVRTRRGWFWLDGRSPTKGTWKATPQGPRLRSASIKTAKLQWKPVTKLTTTAVAQASRVKWVRIRSNGQMGEVMAVRLPRGWNVQYIKAGGKYESKRVNSRLKNDKQIIALFKEHGGHSPMVLIDRSGAAPTPGPPQRIPAPPRVPKPAPSITVDDVTSFLRGMSTPTGGRHRSVDYWNDHGASWSAEPANRQRLDHYVGSNYFPGDDDDPEGWDDDWYPDYADPLAAEVGERLDARFGKGLFRVDVGEKGHVNVYATSQGTKAMGVGKKAMWKKGYVEGNPGAINTMRVMLGNTLAMLRALSWNHWTTHWQAKGVNYYGDHLLFERLYEAISKEIDTLAEKMVSMFGPSSVDAAEQAGLTAALLRQWSSVPDAVERSFKAESAFQKVIEKTVDALDDLGTLSIGLDDFLRTMANDHETAFYLLQQRNQTTRVARLTQPRDARRSFLARAALRLAAQVGTDTASILAISPEMLEQVIASGNWSTAMQAADFKQADQLIRQHGGAVFHTGADGYWDVDVQGSVKQWGSMAPYGTPGFSKAIQRVASRAVDAGWWVIKPGEPGIHIPPVDKGGLMNAIPGTDGADDALYNGDGPADIMDGTIADIDLAYRQAWGRAVTPDELQAVFDFCSGPAMDDGRVGSGDWVDLIAERLGMAQVDIVTLNQDSLKAMQQADRDLRNAKGNLERNNEGNDGSFTTQSLAAFDKRIKAIIEGALKRANRQAAAVALTAKSVREAGLTAGDAVMAQLPGIWPNMEDTSSTNWPGYSTHSPGPDPGMVALPAP